MPRTCIFCGEPANSREHIFGDWVNDALADWPHKNPDLGSYAFSIESGVVIDSRDHPVSELSGARARVVCRPCNNGWMSRIESQAGDILRPMLLGRRRTLDVLEQLAVAAWATKTAMVVESATYGESSFTQEDRDTMRREQRPPHYTRVCLASYSMDQPFGIRWAGGIGTVGPESVKAPTVSASTIQIAHLVASVRTAILPGATNRSLESVPSPRDFEIPIWPPVTECSWPPRHALTNSEFTEYSGGNNVDGIAPPFPQFVDDDD